MPIYHRLAGTRPEASNRTGPSGKRSLPACGGGDSRSLAVGNSVGSLRLIGQQVLPRRSEFGGTVVGGLSGIDYDAVNNRYVLVSDDRATTESRGPRKRSLWPGDRQPGLAQRGWPHVNVHANPQHQSVCA